MDQILHKLPLEDEPRLRPLVELVAICLQHDSFRGATAALLAEFATQLGCSSVSFGVREQHAFRVLATSHAAHFDSRLNLTALAEAAMQEAIEQDCVIALPASDRTTTCIDRAHKDYLQQAKAGSVCTLPVAYQGKLVAAFVLEHPDPAAFAEEALTRCESAAAMAGPILYAKLQEERTLRARAIDAMRAGLVSLIGPRHPALKCATGLFLVAALMLATVSGDYKVSADASLEGLLQRAVVAPIDGYILEARVRAGDRVQAGEVLARLDDRELQLERARWLSEREKIAKSYRSALTQQDRSEVVILKARLDQADAKLELAEEQLRRSNIAAPLAGVIVSGDLSQSLGAPVERGDVLFEVTPLEDYRVMLQVDERDIGALNVGQAGVLALNGFPSERFDFTVTRITPVSVAEDGNNFFLVEAELDNPSPLLRPGMQGVAKVGAGERRLGWILLHPLVDWLRLWWWS